MKFEKRIVRALEDLVKVNREAMADAKARHDEQLAEDKKLMAKISQQDELAIKHKFVEDLMVELRIQSDNDAGILGGLEPANEILEWIKKVCDDVVEGKKSD